MTPASSSHLIRPAKPVDLDRVVAMWADLVRDQDRYVRTVRHTKANRAAMRAHFEKLLAHEQVLVLEDGGALWGFSAVVVDLPKLDFHFASATISDLYVDPARRGRGWGRALLRATLDVITARGLHAVTLSVAHGNDAARALYRSEGFQPWTEKLILPLEPGMVRFGPLHPED